MKKSFYSSHILKCFFTIFLSVIFFPVLAEQYVLSICAIFQNEAEWLKEWIEFHELQGVEHFYLYNNNSTDHYWTVLQPYLQNGTVTLTEWNREFEQGKFREWADIQRGAYQDCLAKFGDQTKWLAIIDLDEFLFCPTGMPLPTFLANYTEFAGVVANWLYFGTSNVQDISPNRLMIEELTRCANGPASLVKSIVQPKFVQTCRNPHFCIYKENYCAVTADYKITNGPFVEGNSIDKIRVNHYWTRTQREFLEKKLPSRQKRRDHHTPEALLPFAETMNESVDTAILQFVPALRTRMGLTN